MIIIIKLCIGAVRVAGSVSLDDVYLHVQLKSIITPFVAFLRNTKFDVAAGHTKARVWPTDEEIHTFHVSWLSSSANHNADDNLWIYILVMFVIIYFTKYSFCILNTVPCHTGILRHYGCVVFCHCFQLLNSWRTRPADRASLQGAISMVSSHNYCLPFSKCQDESCNRFFFRATLCIARPMPSCGVSVRLPLTYV